MFSNIRQAIFAHSTEAGTEQGRRRHPSWLLTQPGQFSVRVSRNVHANEHLKNKHYNEVFSLWRCAFYIANRRQQEATRIKYQSHQISNKGSELVAV